MASSIIASGVMRPPHSTLGIPPIMPGESSLLAQALQEGTRVFWSLASGSAQGLAELDAPRKFLFRRWVLEALLALTIQGPSSFNSLSDALGRPAGESLAPKLDALRAANLVSRSVTSPAPLRVEYSLTAAGEKIGAGVYLLTRWRALQSLTARDQMTGLPGPHTFSRPTSRDETRTRAALDRYVVHATAFRKILQAYCRPRQFEDALSMSKPFCRAWVHKWHAPVLLALALGGPKRFADLRQTLGVGDQALSLALAGLVDLRAVLPSGRDRGPRYEISPIGWSDLSLSVPLTLMMRLESGISRAASGVSA